MARQLQSEASACAKGLGTEGEDWIGITDGPDARPFDVVVKYGHPESIRALHNEEVGDADARESNFVDAHIAFPDASAVRLRYTKRPILRTRLRYAILELYGNVNDVELGKAGLSSIGS